MTNQDKELTERELYEKLLDEYSEKIIYPQYGEWCVNTVMKNIKETTIYDSIEVLEKIFNPQDDYYAEYFEYEPEQILGRINENRYYNDSLYRRLQKNFNEKYWDLYFDMNSELAKKEPDAVTDLISDAEEPSWELFEKVLDEIGVEKLKEIIFYVKLK